jgi:hypothetical protein
MILAATLTPAENGFFRAYAVLNSGRNDHIDSGFRHASKDFDWGFRCRNILEQTLFSRKRVSNYGRSTICGRLKVSFISVAMFYFPTVDVTIVHVT